MTVLFATAGAAALLVAGLYLVVWARWRVRDRRRRRQRLVVRGCWRDELDREQRRLKLRIVERPYPQAPLASRRARP